MAKNVFSQYELEYLRDNVRRSEDVAMENHVYLAYSSWDEFCSYLQILDVRPLLEDKKLVFLMEDEIEQYPIDFKARFGIDYNTYSLQPVGIWELNRIIWHTQLATHNGGDFFNEIFDAHPNLMPMPSLIFSEVEKQIKTAQQVLKSSKTVEEAHEMLPELSRDVLEGLYQRGTFSDKELLLALVLYDEKYLDKTEWNARIVPALFFQPHFYNLEYSVQTDSHDQDMLYSKQYEEIKNSSIFKDFKYIKIFTPMRRITTSYGATIRFITWDEMQNSPEGNSDSGKEGDNEDTIRYMPDELTNRVLNRSFMIDPDDRLYHDSVLVRFEDGKLNPRATFTALAEFLDLPYTESMTYCSLRGERDPESLKGNDLGFSTAAIYRTYDDYANDTERFFLEYLMKDAYVYYGYDFQYYDGSLVDEHRLKEMIEGFDILDHFIYENRRGVYSQMNLTQNGEEVDLEIKEAVRDKLLEQCMSEIQNNRFSIARLLMRNPRFVNRQGQPLRIFSPASPVRVRPPSAGYFTSA